MPETAFRLIIKSEDSKQETEGLLIIYRNLDPVLMLWGREFVKRDIRRKL